MNKIIYIGILFLYAVNALGQTDSCENSLSGKVIDEHDKTPLAFANIYISELQKGVVSDIDGNYVIKNICAGVYNVKVTHIGCEPLETKLAINGNIKRNFFPEHHSEQLKTVSVTTSKAQEKTTQKLETLSQKQMEESKGKSLGESLKNITGVTTLQTGASMSKPVIHGMHSNRILILNNGVRQEGQQWGNEHAPEIDPFVAGSLSVVKGAATVRYGSDAMAGVILVNPKPLRDSAGINGELNLVGFSNGQQGTASGTVDGNFKNKFSPLSWRLQGTFKQGGNIKAPNYFLKNTGMKEYNLSYGLGWIKQNYRAEVYYSLFNTTLGIFSGSHIGNLTDLNKAFSSPVPLENADFTYEIGRPFQHIEHELVKSNLQINTGTAGRLSFTYARQYDLRYEYDKHRPRIDSIASLNNPELQFEITTHTGDIIWEHHRIKSLVGSIGITGMTQGNTYNGRFFIPNFRNYSGGAFWIERFKKEKYELEAGFRYDYKWLQIFKYEKQGNDYLLISPIKEFNNPSGTLGAIYKPDSVWNITYNFGSAWRAPGVNELYSSGLHHGTASIENGNINLNHEMAFNSILSIQYQPNQKLTTVVSGYYNYINNFIYLKPVFPATLTIRGAFPTFHYEQTEAILKGVDASVNYKPLISFEITAKASLLRAWNKTENTWLILMPSDRYESELTYYFNNRKFYSGSYISLTGQFVTKQWRVPVNSDYVSPPSEYFLFNLESGLTIHIKKQAIDFGFGIRNILNTSYRDYMDRFRYFTDAMGRNFSVRVKVPFNFSPKPKQSKANNQIN